MRQCYNREKPGMDIQAQEAGVLCQFASSHKTAQCLLGKLQSQNTWGMRLEKKNKKQKDKLNIKSD